jgi:hypothetical protein
MIFMIGVIGYFIVFLVGGGSELYWVFIMGWFF